MNEHTTPTFKLNIALNVQKEITSKVFENVSEKCAARCHPPHLLHLFSLLHIPLSHYLLLQTVSLLLLMAKKLG